MEVNRTTGQARWEHFDHQADIGVRGVGHTAAEAFEQAAIALTAVVTDPESVVPNREIRIRCEAPDIEMLFVEWLNALIREMATRSMLFRAFSVRIEGTQLRARVRGDRIDVMKHRPAVEVKGASYAELKVAAQPDGTWLAQCVVDV